MDLRTTITDVHKTYSDSVSALSTYVQHIDRAIKAIQADHDRLARKLMAARAGEPDPAPYPPGEELISIELSKEETDLIIDAVKLVQSYSENYPNMTFRMSFAYLIALFDAFLVDIFEAVVQSRPEILKSTKKQISYERLLEFASMDDVTRYLAKRELNELSYKSLKDQSDYYRDRLGIYLEESGVSLNILIELRAARNLLVHSNGVVNHIYLEQVPQTAYGLGESIEIDSAYFASAVRSLMQVAAHITAKLAEKYG